MEQLKQATNKTVSFPFGQTPATTLKGHTGPIHHVALSRDHVYLFTASADRSVKLWNPRTGLCIKTYTNHSKDVLGVSIPKAAADNTKFATCSTDRSVTVTDITTGTPIVRYNYHRHRVNAVEFNNPGSILVSASYDTTVMVWDIRSKGTRKPLQVLEGAKDSVESVCVDDHRIISGSVDGSMRTYDLRACQMIQDHVGQSITWATFTTLDTSCVLATTIPSAIHLVDTRSGTTLSTYTGHTNNSYRIMSTMSPGDGFVASGSETGDVVVWDTVGDGKALGRIRGAHERAVTSIAWGGKPGKGQIMVTGSVDGIAKTWTTTQ